MRRDLEPCRILGEIRTLKKSPDPFSLSLSLDDLAGVFFILRIFSTSNFTKILLPNLLKGRSMQIMLSLMIMWVMKVTLA